MVHISPLLACKYRFIGILSSAYETVRRNDGMQYRSRCNIFNSFRNTLLFMYIYNRRVVNISENIAFLFYKEIYTKYLILYYIIMLFVNFFCNISSYDMLAYITKNYISLIYYAKIVHQLCQFHAGKLSVKLYITSPRARGWVESVNLS
jgi:hypothetical protein